jgi:ubiquinone/menaquinone biosynthesis C-methylase UbiE
MDKPILDVTCGSKMFWFDRDDSRVVFLDNRVERHTLKDKSSRGGFRELVVDPDIVGDFTDLPFDNDTFSLVVFDPPHLKRNGDNSWMGKKYGTLGDDWKEQIRKGFKECFRVLKERGVLVFKWSEGMASVSDVLQLTDEKPLFGNKYGRSQASHWIVFIKLSSVP